MLRILLQRAEETFPAVTERINCTNSEKVLVGPYGGIYPASHDANQAMNIKAEEVSDAEEEADPVQITVQEIKAEPEGNLNEFQPVHGEDRRYSCDECGESFSQQFQPKMKEVMEMTPPPSNTGVRRGHDCHHGNGT
ncbi:uncharacterized protein LOC111871921 [Cryptotermes secundus]|uniref:uncharacterized protein LOC111871921 n=1 Tax=Cryptotermes secundus TaxID=105785 RepID=UPI000CD7D5C9|nr:uncharacterized protein LOC111871921 [Cryptotermes secundus]